MENNIETIMKEILKLKLESDRWRNIKNDLLEFRKKELETKKYNFGNSKRIFIENLKREEEHNIRIENYGNRKYKKEHSEKEIGCLELVLNLHVELLENENETLRSVYEKYKLLISTEKLIDPNYSYNSRSYGYENDEHKYKDFFNDWTSSQLEKLLNLKDEIIELEKAIKDGRFFPCEEISSIEGIKKELDKFLLVEKELKELREVNKALEIEFENIEDELELERNTNLEMLKKLEIFNENKLKDNLAIKDNIIRNLEQKLEKLEVKYSELTIEED